MNHVRAYEVTLAVEEPITAAANKELFVQSQLESIYLGRCYKGAFITRILSLTRVSDIVLGKTNSYGEARIHVAFTARVWLAGVWDILVGAEVKGTTGLVTCEYRVEEKGEAPVVVAVSLYANPFAAAAAVGHKVAIRIVKTHYSPMRPFVSVHGVILTCERLRPVYYAPRALRADRAQELGQLVAAVDRERALRANAPNHEAIQFFELLLHPYRLKAPADADLRHPSRMPGADYMDVVELARAAAAAGEAGEAAESGGGHYWTRPLDLASSSSLSARLKEPPPGAKVIESTPEGVLAEHLGCIYNFLRAAREMAEIYDEAEIKRHMNIWNAMRSAQLAE